MKSTRDSIVRRAFIAALLLPALSWGQDKDVPFLAKTVTLYTAFAPGSGPDLVLRQVALRLSEHWKQKVRVENRPGGGGFVAIDATKTQPADGYALVQLDSYHLAASPYLYPKRAFQPLQAFEPVTALFETPFLIVVSSKSPWSSVGELMAAAKSTPGKFSYGSWGLGSPGHLGGAQLESLMGVETVHVAYKDSKELYRNVANQQVSWAMTSIPTSREFVKAGSLRYLAVARNQRISQLPQVPTISESGGPSQLNVNAFVVLMAPKGLPAETATRIHKDAQQVLSGPELQKMLTSYAYEPLQWSGSEIVRHINSKSKDYGSVIQNAKIYLD